MGSLLTTKRWLNLRRIVCVLAILLTQQRSFADLSGDGDFFVTLADPQVSLQTLSLTNSQIQFALNGEPGVSYVIESSPDLSNWTPVLTNNDSTVTRTITVQSTNATSFYRAARAPIPLFQYALAARGNINLVGSYKVTDSFNSGVADSSTNGQYDPTKADTNGNVASVEGLVYISSETIGGNLLLGPTAGFASGTNQVLGSIQTDQNISFPDVVVTNAVWVAPANINGTNVIPVTGYYFINNSLPINVPAGVTAAIIVSTTNFFTLNIQIHGGTTNSGTAYVFLDTPNATIWANTASDASNEAKNLCIFGLPHLTNFIVTSTVTHDFFGVIYAPSATATLDAGGTVRNFSGSCIAKSVSLNGNWFLHFDEDLLNSGPFR